MRCSRQRAHEREEGIAAVASADLERLAPPTQRARRVSGAGECVPLAGFRTGVRPLTLRDGVDVG